MLYRYEALDTAGKVTKGTEEAGSPVEARAGLRDRGLLPTELSPLRADKPGSSGPAWVGLSGRRLDLVAGATRHLALLLRTGVPLGQALEVLAGQSEDRGFGMALRDVALRVKEGSEVGEALSAQGRYFPPLLVEGIRAGVEAGDLPRVLVDMAAHYARQKKMRDRLISAITYPALMSAVGVLVLVFLLAFVVPKVTAILLEQERALPWPTIVLLAASDFLSSFGWAILPGVALAIAFLVRLTWQGRGRFWRDRALLALPVVGGLVRKQVVARWAGTMSTLVASGLPVVQALRASRGAVGNGALEAELFRLEEEIVSGSSLSQALAGCRLLPPALGLVAGVGEEAGDLSGALREVADTYDQEVEVAATRLTDLLNPVLIVVLGVVVGFIVAAILLPITDFSNVQ
jgi:type II secretory pathway component PulF